MLLQVLIFNNILIGRMISPFFYILFLILLPFNTPRAVLLLLAFILGLSIDVFTNTMGVHALESVSAPRVENMSMQWFTGYAAFIIVIHHLVLFYIEAFTFEGFLFTFIRVILSSILTLAIIVLSQFLIFRK